MSLCMCSLYLTSLLALGQSDHFLFQYLNHVMSGFISSHPEL